MIMKTGDLLNRITGLLFDSIENTNCFLVIDVVLEWLARKCDFDFDEMDWPPFK